MKLKSITKFFVIIFFISFYSCRAEQQENADTIFVAFWNLENLFDVIDDPEKDDQEFLPDGVKEWTQERLDKKMYNIARALNSMNDENAPDVIGVVESENQIVLESLVKKYFGDKKYQVAYIESPDNRGIDCGFIFRSDKFSLINVVGHEVSKLKGSPTRLILQVTLKTLSGESVVFFVNHWPSRREGASQTEHKRISSAQVLRREVDKLFSQNKKAKIIIMGDFNDEPVDESILKTLKAEPFKCDIENKTNIKVPSGELYNVSYNLFEAGYGTISFREDWNMFDQIIISSGLVMQKGFSYVCDTFSIFNNDLVSTRSGKYKGTPFPTFGGNRYLGGYSDHFAVTAKFIVR